MNSGFFLIFMLFGLAGCSAHAAEFSDEVERDFSIRTIGQLNVTNLRGDVSIQGWSLDRIRVKARRKVIAETKEEAAKFLAALDFRYQMVAGDIELSAEYGRGLTLEERLKERRAQKSEMQITVFAPSNLKLRLWTVDGKASLKSWNAPAEIRTAKGPILAEDVKAQNLSLMCPACTITAKSIRAGLRCIGGAGDVDLSGVDGANIYVESDAGNVRIHGAKGEQLYVLKSGSLSARGLNGRIEFHSQKGAIDITESSGFLSGRSESGNIVAKMDSWKFFDKALVESVDGAVSLALPANFSGEIDIWSLHGKTVVGFPYEKTEVRGSFGPEPASRVMGIVGDGGEVLKVYSEKGDVSVVKMGKN